MESNNSKKLAEQVKGILNYLRNPILTEIDAIKIKRWLKHSNKDEFDRLSSSLKDLKIGTIIYNLGIFVILTMILLKVMDIKDKLDTTKAYCVESVIGANRLNIKLDSLSKEIKHLKKENKKWNLKNSQN